MQNVLRIMVLLFFTIFLKGKETKSIMDNFAEVVKKMVAGILWCLDCFSDNWHTT